MAATLLRRAMHLRRALTSPSPSPRALLPSRLLSSAASTHQNTAATTIDLSSDESRRRLVNSLMISGGSRPAPGPGPLRCYSHQQCTNSAKCATVKEGNIPHAPGPGPPGLGPRSATLMYRSKQRGFLELDLVLGTWVEQHVRSMDEANIRSLLQILDLENPNLWKWLTGQEQPPETVNSNPVFAAIKSKVTDNLSKHSSPETRSAPGQPWVRGWDDKRGLDGPKYGNQ